MRKLRAATYDERKARHSVAGRCVPPVVFFNERIEGGKLVPMSHAPARRPSIGRSAKKLLAEHEKEVALGMLLGSRGEREGFWGIEVRGETVGRNGDGAVYIPASRGRNAHFWLLVERVGTNRLESVCGGHVVPGNESWVLKVHDAGTRKGVCGYCAVIVQRENA